MSEGHKGVFWRNVFTVRSICAIINDNFRRLADHDRANEELPEEWFWISCWIQIQVKKTR